MLLCFRLSLISPALYCLGIHATEKLHAIFRMEINASFGRRGNDRGVLFMFFHFQPVSFSLEALPCRSPCPFATDVLSERKTGVVLWISFQECCIFFSPPSFVHTDFFFFFYLELGCQEKEKKRSEISTQRLNQIQSCL